MSRKTYTVISEWREQRTEGTPERREEKQQCEEPADLPCVLYFIALFFFAPELVCIWSLFGS